MRVLALTSLYPRPGHETLAPFNRQQFRALAERAELCVIAPVPWTVEAASRARGVRTPRRRDDAGVEVRHPLYFYPPKVLPHLYGECYRASVGREFARAVSEFRPDVVLGCFAHPDGWAAASLARRAGLSMVLKIVGTDVLVSGRAGLRRRKVSEALRQADGVVAVSRDLADHAIRLGADPGRIRVIAEGIDTDLFRPGDRSEARARLGLAAGVPTVLFVGNILRSKGAAVLVEACSILAARGVDFSCYLVGRGRDEGHVRGLVSRLGLSGRVGLAGPRALSELPDWYRASDVVALPSFSEGVPNVLREARACGVPFVASRVGGIPEIAGMGTSLLVEPGDPGALADALGRALDGGLSGGGGPAGAGPLSWGESAGLLAEALREAVTRNKTHARDPGARYVDPDRGRSDDEGPAAAASASREDVPIPATKTRKAPRLRVLALTSLYPRPGHETLAPFNRQQFRALAERAELCVIAPVPWTVEAASRARGVRTPRRRDDAGVEVRHPLYFYPPKVLPHLYGECYRASVGREFARAVSEFRPDVVLGCFAHPDGWAAASLARRAGLPVVIKSHGSAVLVATRDPARRRKVSEALRQADGVVAVSRDLADHIIRLGADPGRVCVVYNGIDTDLFRPGDRSEARARLGLAAGVPTVLFVGNILRSKGAAVLVEACSILAARGVDFSCYLVGCGRDEGHVRGLVSRLGLSGRVGLAGPREFPELPDWYRASDVVALPSFSEGVPNVLREARACGVPFVASRVGGIPEIAGMGTSLLVEPGDPGALADALGRALDGELSGAGGAAGAGPLSWGESAGLLAEALREAVTRNKTHAWRGITGQADIPPNTLPVFNEQA